MRRPVLRLPTDVPLRVKLISAMLALVTMALVVIGVASALVTRSSLYSRVDSQLKRIVDTIVESQMSHLALVTGAPLVVSISPPNKLDSLPDPPDSSGRPQLSDLPPMPAGDQITRRLSEGPYNAKARGTMERWRLYLVRVSSGQLVLVGESLADVDTTIDHLVAVELLVGAGVLVLLAGIGVAIVQRSLHPLREIERTSAAIAAGDLTRRVPELPPETEVGRLAHALNAMLAQIEWAFRTRAASEERMRQFVADASHELRTPLTTIRGFAELYRQGASRDPAETAALLKRIEDEASRMGLLVEDLLTLARLDQERPLTVAPMDLRVIVNDAAEAARVVAPDRVVNLEVERDEPVMVDGDEPRLRQVVGNLVTNALTHTPPGTPVAVRLRVDGSDALIEVADSGPGLSEEQARRVFERFYRVDKARTRRAAGSTQAVTPHSGSGLGLAIVAALVAVHQGTVSVHTTVGGGATFQVRLPLAAGSQSEHSEPEVDLGIVNA
jgi:two-component system OmpR family sensor kinase